MEVERIIIDDMVRINEPVDVDNSIESFAYIDYNLQALANINTDGAVLNFDIQASDRYLVPSKSFIVISGRLENTANNNPFDQGTEVTLINNAPMYLFKNASFEMAGERVEYIDNPGQTTSILGYLSYPDDFNSSSGLSICWSKDTTNHASSMKYNRTPAVAADAAIAAGAFTADENPNFNKGFDYRKKFMNSSNPRGLFQFVIPFRHIFGFAEYSKCLYNTKMSLTLTRDANTLAIHKAAGVNNDGAVVLTDIKWRVPEIKLSDGASTHVLELLKRGEPLPVSYTRRNNYRTQLPQGVTTHTWRSTITAGIEKPRWIIIAFQTNKIANQTQNPAVFDNVGLRQARVRINGEQYPKYPFLTNFQRNEYCQLYQCMDEFKKEFYGYNSLIGGTQISYKDFKSLFPITVIDVRRQSEVIKHGNADIEVGLDFDEAVPANTHMYIIMLSDSLYKLTADGNRMSLVRK